MHFLLFLVIVGRNPGRSLAVPPSSFHYQFESNIETDACKGNKNLSDKETKERIAIRPCHKDNISSIA
jgi:hypothetical protein